MILYQQRTMETYGGRMSMFFEFDPWQLDIDIELTKQFYKDNDYSIDKAANMEFIEQLSAQQLDFFHSFGVDLTKVEVDKTIYDLPKDEETPASKLYRISVNFLIRGSILALPQYQKDLYCDEELFGKQVPKSIKVLSSDDKDDVKVFDNGIGTGIVFKHPCFHYEDDRFKDWDCGYLLGTILIMQDLEK